MDERELLHRHGTKLLDLKPQMIVQAAMFDLKIKARKREFLPLEPTLIPLDHQPMPVIAATYQYLFHRKHVMKADDAVQLIAIAIDDRKIGEQSAKFHTRLIYKDGALLRAALATARVEPTADERDLYAVYRALVDCGEEQ